MKTSTNAFDIRVVHLDLKGVPPLAERLLKLPELFSAAGYNAVLIEFEDMFPWTVDKRFRSPNCYSVEELRQFANICNKMELRIIPLVQTLGHMETFLQPNDYDFLREVPNRHETLNCLANGAQEFVIKLLEDVLNVFPDIEYFHIGCDEAFAFGTHRSTRGFIEKHGKVQLLQKHIEPLEKYLGEKNIRTLLWHDMLADCEPGELTGFNCHCEIVVWGYWESPYQTTGHYSAESIRKLQKLNLPLWTSTAYKGCESRFADLPNIKKRCKNALGWLVANNEFDFKGGIATAWSRHSTYSIQSEPIEPALDSLVCIGQMLMTGKIPKNIPETCKEILLSVGEFNNFKTCYESMRNYSDILQGAWDQIRELTEHIAIEELRNECRYSDTYQKQLKTRNDGHINKVEQATKEIYEKLRFFTYESCLDEYFLVRLNALRQQFDLIDRQAKSLRNQNHS